MKQTEGEIRAAEVATKNVEMGQRGNAQNGKKDELFFLQESKQVAPNIYKEEIYIKCCANTD